MEFLKHSRNILIIIAALAAIAVLAAAFFMWPRGEDEPEFSLPSLPAVSEAQPSAPPGADTDVSAENVLAVLGALRRAEAYEREIEFTAYWPGGENTASITVRADGPSLRIIRQSAGEICDVLVDGDSYCVTYGGRGGFYHGTLGDERAREASELMQLISFEGIENRPGFAILDAGLHDLDGEACIYMEYTFDSGLDYITRVYVGVEHGLVVAEQTLASGEPAFSMKSISLELTTPPESAFLHAHDD